MIASYATVLVGSFFTQTFFSWGFWVVDIILLLAIAGVVIVLATDDRDPSTVLAWLFVVLLLPVLGLIAYFFIGRNFRRDSPRRRKIMAQMDAVAEDSLAPVTAANTEFTEAARADLAGTAGARIEAVGFTEGGVAPLPADTVDIYTAGSQKFPALLEEMATAEKYIHLMYLIWEQDELTAKVTKVLLDRLEAGVKVHILYDWLSCISFKKDELKQLEAAGAVVAACYKRLPQINYRNHMKMVIIDGKSVYSGGMNMGQEYIDGGPRFDVWRDTSFRLSGPVVAPYLMLFASTWLYNGGTEDLATDFMPPAAEHHRHEGIPVQVLHSSVQTTFKTNRDVFITALTNARRAHLDPVAVLRAGRAADDGHVHGGGERHRRALHDDRRAGQEDPLLRRPRLLPDASPRRREGLPVQGRVPARQDGDRGRPALDHRHLQLGHPQPHPARRGGLGLLRRGCRDGRTRTSTPRTSRTACRSPMRTWRSSRAASGSATRCYRLFSRLL